MLKTIVLAGLIGLCVSFSCDSGDQLVKVGCMERNSKVFEDMLANNRDKSSSVFIGETIDWNAYDISLQKLSCACAQKAKEGGYVAFGLGFYGECFGTKDKAAYEEWITKEQSVSNNCIGHTYQECKESDALCIGMGFAEYVYTFPSKAPEVVNGGYGEWSPYSECSATCGEGFKERERVCNNPLPANGGADCAALGEATETSKCNLKACPVNGGFSEWSAYSTCSKSCGGGSKKRTRSCTNPAPANGGADCNGATVDEVECGTDLCPVNGGYSSWSTYGSCSKSCGGGQQSRTRKCNNPTPANGGSQCSGVSSESKNCNTQPCLASATCSNHETAFKSDGDGKAVYLDRHSVHCPSGKVMRSLKLERNSNHNQIRYDFDCCTSQLPCNDLSTNNGQTYNGGGEGNTVYLDRQTISCGNRGLSYLKLDRSGDKWNYKYHCCQVSYSKASISCYEKDTLFNADGDGKNVYLDRHHLSCPSTYYIASMKLNRNSNHGKIRYTYKCCKVNTPAATN